jgi:hypothetical protein
MGRARLRLGLRMGGHGTVAALVMEGDPASAVIEWIIRVALLALALAAVWTVFGDDIAQFIGR